MKPYLAFVTWNDAQGSATLNYDKVRDHAPVVMKTVGWVVDRNEAGISICCEQWTENGLLNWRGHTFIPAGMVVKVTRA